MISQSKKRQRFLDEAYLKPYLRFYSEEVQNLIASYDAPEQTSENRIRLMGIVANHRYQLWCARFTGGEDIAVLRNDFESVVADFVSAARYEREVAQEPDLPLFDFSYRDDYAQVLGLISLCILLHQETLLPSVYGLFAGGAPDGTDALVEDLLGKYISGRPVLSDGYHNIPYGYLLDATAQTPEQEKQDDIEEYLKAWYPGMSSTGWYDSHKRQNAEGGGGYFGYWAFEAAAIAYLYDIDDTPFRNHLVYPKDLADFARSMPRQTLIETTAGQVATRCEGGQPCPRSGWWHTPAREGSRQHFNAGTAMPKYDSDYGLTIWQWDADQSEGATS